ncbi:MAG: hypothetical protein U1F42_05055, partial [Candidatus Competibacteraceae bacterium]
KPIKHWGKNRAWSAFTPRPGIRIRPASKIFPFACNRLLPELPAKQYTIKLKIKANYTCIASLAD